MLRFITIEKKLGETPLECAEAWRAKHPEYQNIPLAYAGRLDPMASGKLLVLIGEECKRQAEYHALDKAYHFEVLLGVSSDTADILGLVEEAPLLPSAPDRNVITNIMKQLQGTIELPYPTFSAKTVRGKPLHMWTLENRLHEITIPTKRSTIYKIALTAIETTTREAVCADALTKIELPTPVTDPKKSLGNDFRRPLVREAWQTIRQAGTPNDTFYRLQFSCIASSGTYMRTLATVIAKHLNTTGLAYSIERTTIGRYQPLIGRFGFWRKRY